MMHLLLHTIVTVLIVSMKARNIHFKYYFELLLLLYKRGEREGLFPSLAHTLDMID